MQAVPQPSLHTASEWSSVIQHMQAHLNSGIPGIKTPTEQEMKTILGYMQKNVVQYSGGKFGSKGRILWGAFVARLW
jgi:hypothetical protein